MHPLAGIPKIAEHKAKIRASNIATRKTWTPEMKAAHSANLSASLKGQIPWNKGRQGIPAWNKGNNWRESFTEEEVKKITAERARKYRSNNPRVRVDDRISALIRQALHERKGRRTWESLVGYTSQELCDHLESLFLPEMTWDNMGDWHIDHIRPRSSFHYELETDPEFRECWKLSNLRPLWAKDNLRKGNRIIEQGELL